MSVNRFELQQREYQERGSYHFSDLNFSTAEGIESIAKLELTLNTIAGSNPASVADFGCGEGVLVHSLRSQSICCIGLDLSIQALTLAPAEIKGYLIQADLEKVPLQDQCFDVVSMIAVLEHIYPPNISNVLKEAKRVIKKGGRLVVRVPSQNQSLEPKHYQHFTEVGLREMLMSNGFTVERIIGNHNTLQDWGLYYSSLTQVSEAARYEAYQKVFAISNPVRAKRLLAVGLNT